MRRLLLMTLMGTFALQSFGQQTWDNFEDQRKLFYDFTHGLFIPYTENPDPTGNTSPVVASYTRNAAELFDVIVIDAISKTENLADYVSNTKQMTIDVWSPRVGVTVQITLEDTTTATDTNFPVGRHSIYLTTTTVANAWETLTFSFDSRPDASVPDDNVGRMILLFDPNTNTTDQYYFDNLVGPGLVADPCDGVSPVETVLNDFECNQNSNFTFNHGESLRRIPNPDASGLNTSDFIGSYTRNDGEEFDVIRGSFPTPLPLTDSSTFKLKVWDANAPTEVRLALQFDDGSGNPATELAAVSANTSAASQWEELEFGFGDLSNETVNTFVILFDPGSFSSDQYFFDDFQYSEVAVGIEDYLSQASLEVFPNPSQGITQFAYELIQNGEVSLRIYDISGKEVALIQPGLQAMGRHTLSWEATSQPAGLYFYQLQVDGQVTSGKIVLER